MEESKDHDYKELLRDSVPSGGSLHSQNDPLILPENLHLNGGTELSKGESHIEINDTAIEMPTNSPNQHSIEELANVAADSSPLGKEKEEQRKRYETICRLLNVDEQTRLTAWDLLSKMTSEDYTKNSGHFWIACALFVAGNDDKRKGFSLSQLLRESKIRMVDFFEPLKTFITTLQLGTSQEERLKLLEKKFVVITILFQKYEKIFSELMHGPTSEERTLSRGRKSDNFQLFSFGWILFLVSRGKLLSDPHDLVHSFHLLICCVNLLFMHCPPHLRKVSLKDSKLAKQQETVDGSETINTLSYCCELNGANYMEVLVVQDHLFGPFIQMLCKNNILKYSEKYMIEQTPVRNDFLMMGLLDSYHLHKNKDKINREYELMYYASGDFDERLFIDQIDQIGTPSKVTYQTKSYYHLNSKSHSNQPNISSALFSPYRKSPFISPDPFSPMSTTLATVSWLKTVLSSKDDKPSEILLRFFRECNTDITEIIISRVETLSASLKIEADAFTGLVTEWSEKPRIDLGVKLYYKLLESILLAEETRLHQTNFTALLINDIFHRSLLACCVEIVLFSFKMTDMAFPYILHRFQLKAFEFFKIVESVVRHEPDFPRAIVRHLNNIEEKILESLAWEENSTVFLLMEDKSNRSYVVENQIMSPAGTLQALASPVSKNKHMGTLETSIATSRIEITSPLPTKKGSAHSIELFYRKVFHLASMRCRDLCNRLAIMKYFQQIWQSIVFVLTEKFRMLRNRHIDQMIMCSIYGISRVLSLGVTFRQIIDQYRSQPQANLKIFREIPLDNSDGSKVDIIIFYNNIFIPSMESFLLQFQQQQQNDYNAADLSDKKSPQKVTKHNNTNLYLSPMRLRPSPNNYASSRFLYSFGSPSKGLRQINDSLNSPKASSLSKRLFSDYDNGSDENAKTGNMIFGNNNVESILRQKSQEIEETTSPNSVNYLPHDKRSPKEARKL